MKNELWISGAPSTVGGADTELLNNIYLWRNHGVGVNIVPCHGILPEMKLEMEAIGCKFHTHSNTIFKDKIVVSYCNGNFLKALPQIIEKGRPKKVIWFNCMTWLFEPEVLAIKNGWIDLHGFVSEYQKSRITDAIQQRLGVSITPLTGYQPYFNFCPSMYRYNPPTSEFTIGRISRDDPAKFSDDLWSIMDNIDTGIWNKKIHIMGYSAKVEKKVGPPPVGLVTDLKPVNAIPVREFYHSLNAVLHKTGGSRESYCRIVPECYAHGVPIIVEDDFAFPELVIDGVTGFRCKTSEEMSERVTQLAKDEDLRKRIILNAKLFLKDQISCDEKCMKPWLEILNG